MPSGQSGALSYDAAGNLTTDTYTGAGTRVYDAENRMTQAQGGAQGGWQYYSYNADGQRTRRKIDNVETWQVYGFDGELLAEYPQGGATASPQKEYGYRNGQLLITAAPGSSSSGPAATFLQTDTTTQGNWKGVYGVDGYNVIANAASYPAYAQVSVTGQNSHTWVDPTADVRGMEKAANTDHLAACWYAGGNFTVDLNLTDGNEHKVALYVLDWDGNNTRATRIEVLNAATNAVLDSRDATSFSNGKYFVWSLRGHVKFKLTYIGGGGSNAVLSGLFFDPVAGGGGGTQNVSWTNAQGVSVSANTLTKTAVTGWGNAGASSTQTLASGDGYVEFTGAQLGTDRILGLSNGDTNQTWEDIDFGLYLRGDNVATVVEFGTYYPQYNVSFTAGDVFRVSVESGVVKYRKNGVVYHTSPGIPAYPLKVDTALYTSNSTLTNAVLGGNWSGGSGGGGSSSSSSEVLWLVADHLGTPRMILDQSGSLANIKRHDYLPFGEELFAGTGGRTTAQGYTANDNVRQKFTSKERDNETGLDYFEARYYGSIQGRFIGADPYDINLERQKTADREEANALFRDYIQQPQHWNRYVYALNNPLRYVDPDGLMSYETELLGKKIKVKIADDLKSEDGKKLKGDDLKKAQDKIKQNIDNAIAKINSGQAKLTSEQITAIHSLKGIEVRTDISAPGMNTSSKVFYLTQRYAGGATLDTLTAAIIHDSHHADQAKHGRPYKGIEAEKEASRFTVPIIKALGLDEYIIRTYEYDAEHGHGRWGQSLPKSRQPKKKTP